jgi:hypothetical protein
MSIRNQDQSSGGSEKDACHEGIKSNSAEGQAPWLF